MNTFPVAGKQPERAAFSPAAQPNIDFLPDPKKKEPLGNGVISAGRTISICGNAILLFSPLINKKALPIIQTLTRRMGPNSPLSLLKEKQLQQLKEVLENRERLVKHLWSLLGVGFLLQLPIEYKTSLNCKQPSMFACNLVTTISTSFMLFSSNVAFRVMTILGDVFHRAGKYNDIENSNHLAQRREMDIRRLMPHQKDASFGNSSFKQELPEFGRFMRTDLRQVFSLRPWKNLFGTYKEKETWTQSNSNLSALAGQFSLLAGCNSLLSTVSRFPAPVRNALRGMTAVSIVLHDAMFQAPIFTRAWKNRDELEGKLVIGSVPFYMLGSPFFLSSKYLFMNSFTGLANPFWAKGINLNSEHRLAAINYIKKMYHAAQSNPQLTAVDVLIKLADPKLQNVLSKQLGKSGLRFVLNTFHSAAVAEQQNQTSLSAYLYPITISRSETPSLAAELTRLEQK